MNERMSERGKTMIQPSAVLRPAGSAAQPTSAVADRRQRRQRYLIVSAIGCVVAMGLAAWVVTDIFSQANSEDVHALGVYRSHEAAVRGLALSFDGSLAASGDDSGTLRLWDPRDRGEPGKSLAASGPIQTMALSLDGKRLASAGSSSTNHDGRIQLWNTDRAEPGDTLEDPKHKPVTCLVFYPTGSHLLSGSRDGRILLWDLNSKKIERQATVEPASVTSLAVTPDGLQFLSGDSSGVLRLWQMASGREVCRLSGHQGAVQSLAVAPLGSRALSCGADGTLRLWNLEGQRELACWQAIEGETPLSIAYSPGGTRALATYASGTVRIWSTSEGVALETFTGHQQPACCAAFFPSSLVALTGSHDHTIRYWQTVPGELEAKQAELARDNVRRQAEKLRKFAGQIELGQQLLDEKKFKPALAEFREAGLLVGNQSLEYRKIHEQADRLAATIEAGESFERHVKLADAAVKNHDYAEAMRQFDLARSAVRGRNDMQDLAIQAERGYNQCALITETKAVLKNLEVTDKSLEFKELAPTEHLLDHGKSFTFLLTAGNDSTMAVSSTPLMWTIDLKTRVPFPKAEVNLKTELVHLGSGETVAVVEHTFVPGKTEQHFSSEAAPPASGWLAGTYELRSSLTTIEGAQPVGQPQQFPLGVVRWKESFFEVEPAKLIENDFKLPTKIQLAYGDGVIVKAEGIVAPAPVQLYRELLANVKIAEPVPAKPEGIPWSNDALRQHKYPVVDIKSNFSALLMRIGKEGIWLPYQTKFWPLPAPAAGEIELSINSVLPPTPTTGIARRALTKEDRSYWAPNCGVFKVTVLHATFDFPKPLTFYEKGALLVMRFKNY
jgi:hypothetical protein